MSKRDAHRAVATGTAPHGTDDARARLLAAGLQLFAQQGYSQTSTRKLAETACVNVAAISYYFGDKAGLYKAVFEGPMGTPAEDFARFEDPGLCLAQALRVFFQSFLEPLKQGDIARMCMKLHFREMVEPTGLWEEALTHSIQPMHDGLVAVLCRHFGLEQADDDLLRLAICLAGLGVHMHVGRDVTDHLAPGLMDDAGAIDLWAERLTLFGLAMVQAETQRRAEASPHAPPAAPMGG